MLDGFDSSVAVNRITEEGKTISIEIRLLMLDEEMHMHDYPTPPNCMLAVDRNLWNFAFALRLTDSVAATLPCGRLQKIDGGRVRGR